MLDPAHLGDQAACVVPIALPAPFRRLLPVSSREMLGHLFLHDLFEHRLHAGADPLLQALTRKRLPLG